jgi:hypothetical protein
MIDFLKKIFKEVKLYTPIFTCKGCIVLPCCTMLCDKVRNGLELKSFINKYYCCPDCGGDILQSEDGKDHCNMRYQRCYSCGHFFTTNDYILDRGLIVQREISTRAKEEQYKFKDIDRSGH